MFLVLIELAACVRDYHESITGNNKNDGSTWVDNILKYGWMNKFYLCNAITKIVVDSKSY